MHRRAKLKITLLSDPQFASRSLLFIFTKTQGRVNRFADMDLAKRWRIVNCFVLVNKTQGSWRRDLWLWLSDQSDLRCSSGDIAGRRYSDLLHLVRLPTSRRVSNRRLVWILQPQRIHYLVCLGSSILTFQTLAVASCTTSFNIINATLSPQTLYLYVLRVSQNIQRISSYRTLTYWVF